MWVGLRGERGRRHVGEEAPDQIVGPGLLGPVPVRSVVHAEADGAGTSAAVILPALDVGRPEDESGTNRAQYRMIARTIQHQTKIMGTDTKPQYK